MFANGGGGLGSCIRLLLMDLRDQGFWAHALAPFWPSIAVCTTVTNVPRRRWNTQRLFCVAGKLLEAFMAKGASGGVNFSLFFLFCGLTEEDWCLLV